MPVQFVKAHNRTPRLGIVDDHPVVAKIKNSAHKKSR